MAGHFQYCTQFITPATVTSTDVLSGYVDDWSVDRSKPFRGWRSNGVSGDKTITLDAGSAQDLAGIGIFSVNTPQIKIQMSTDAAAWTGLPGAGEDDLYLPALFQGVYGYFVSFVLQSKRAIRVICPTGQTPRNKQNTGYYEAAPAYHEIGTIFWCKAVETVGVNPGKEIGMDLDTGEREDTLESGRIENQRVGFPSSSFNLEPQFLTSVQLAEWRALTAPGKNRPVLWFLNQDAPEEILWAQLTGKPRESSAGLLTHFSSNWRTIV